jgi:hypothetical protein
MSTHYTANASFPYSDFRDRNWHVPLLAMIGLLDAEEAIGPLSVTTSENPSTTLHVDVAAGSFVSRSGAVVSYAGTTNRAMTLSATNYLYLTDAGVLTVNTTGWPASTNIVRLATVDTDGTKVTGITGARIPWTSSGGTLAVFVGSGTSHAPGIVPDPPATAGTRKFLREDSSWAEPPVFVGSGSTHATGYVPDAGASAGTTRYLREDGTWTVPPGTGGPGTVTSVALSLPAIITVSGSPVTTSGTLTGTLATQTANLVLAGPATGSPAAPTFRVLAVADIPDLSSLYEPAVGGSAAEVVVAIDDTDSPYALDVPTRVLYCDPTAAAITVNLPAATDGRIFHVWSLSAANFVTIVADGLDTFNGGLSSMQLVSLGDHTVLRAYNGVWYRW